MGSMYQTFRLRLCDILNAWIHDRFSNALKHMLDRHGLPMDKRLRTAVIAMMPYCKQFNGILYYRDHHEERYRIYIPESM